MKSHLVSPSTHIKSRSRITKTMKWHLNNIPTHIKLILLRYKRNEMAPQQHLKTHQIHALSLQKQCKRTSSAPQSTSESYIRITTTIKRHLNNISTHIQLMLWRHERNEMAPQQHLKTHQTHALAIESDNYKRVDG